MAAVGGILYATGAYKLVNPGNSFLRASNDQVRYDAHKEQAALAADERKYGPAINAVKFREAQLLYASGGDNLATPFIDSSGKPSYTIVRLLGKGAYAKVFKAKKAPMGTVYAIKLSENEGIESAIRESKILQHLRNCSCEGEVPLFEFVDLRLFGIPEAALVLKWMPSDLNSLLAAYPLEGFQSIDLMLDIIEAVQHLHRCGTIHRDMKPANILVDANPNRGFYALVGDFGLSHLAGIKGTNPDNYLIPGTPLYKPPELMRYPRPAWHRVPTRTMPGELDESYLQRCRSPAVDAWAVGCILVEMLIKTSMFGAGPLPPDPSLGKVVLLQEMESYCRLPPRDRKCHLRLRFEDRPNRQDFRYQYSFAYCEQLVSQLLIEDRHRRQENFANATSAGLFRKCYQTEKGLQLAGLHD